MKTTAAVVLSTLMAAGAGTLILPEMAGAGGFGPMNMMNPGRWFGGRDHYDDDYYGRRPPPPPPPPAYSAPPAYGGQVYSPAAAAPATTSSAADSAYKEHIQRLEERIRELETRRDQRMEQQSSPYTGGYRPNNMESQRPDSSASQPAYGGYQPSYPSGMSGMKGGYQPSNAENVSQMGSNSPYSSAAPVFRPME